MLKKVFFFQLFDTLSYCLFGRIGCLDVEDLATLLFLPPFPLLEVALLLWHHNGRRHFRRGGRGGERGETGGGGRGREGELLKL